MKEDVDAGEQLLRALDARGFPVDSALWMHNSDQDEWRLLIGTPRAAVNLKEAYIDIARAMDDEGDLRRRLDLSRIKVVPRSDRLLSTLAGVMRVDGTEHVRFPRNVIDGFLIDDALIYRLAA